MPASAAADGCSRRTAAPSASAPIGMRNGGQDPEVEDDVAR